MFTCEVQEASKTCILFQDTASLVVLDNFFGPRELCGLLESLAGTSQNAQGPPEDKWERNTADDVHGCKTWGLKAAVLQNLVEHPTEAMIEVQSRLVSNVQ